VARTSRRRSTIDERTTRHAGYDLRPKKRKRIEEVFAWLETVAGLCEVRHRGMQEVAWMFTIAAAAYNLIRKLNLRFHWQAA